MLPAKRGAGPAGHAAGARRVGVGAGLLVRRQGRSTHHRISHHEIITGKHTHGAYEYPGTSTIVGVSG